MLSLKRQLLKHFPTNLSETSFRKDYIKLVTGTESLHFQHLSEWIIVAPESLEKVNDSDDNRLNCALYLLLGAPIALRTGDTAQRKMVS